MADARRNKGAIIPASEFQGKLMELMPNIIEMQQGGAFPQDVVHALTNATRKAVLAEGKTLHK